jgi:hypothetical protein
MESRGGEFPPPGVAEHALRANDLDRATAGSALDAAYADGELDAEEYHRRLSSAMQAKTRGELTALLSDLQVPHDLPSLPRTAPVVAPTSGTRSRRVIWLPAAAAVGVAVVVAAVTLAATRHSSTTSSARATGGTSGAAATTVLTGADGELFGHLPAGYRPTDCEHTDLTVGELAALECSGSSRRGTLTANFYLFPDQASMQFSYDNDRSQDDHIPCADGSRDTAYTRPGSPAQTGRYQCFTSHDSARVPSVEWSSEPQHVLGVVFAQDSGGAATILSWWRQHGALR